MLSVFLIILSPMLVLFSFMVIGYIAKKCGALPDESDKVLARLQTNIVFPALNFITMARNCTPNTLKSHGVNILLGSIMMLIAIAIATLISGFFIKKDSPERGVYKYALAFANSSYVGDPLILRLFGEQMLSFYKMYTLPLTVGIYSWGIRKLIPKEAANKKNLIKNLFNPSIIGLLLGIIFGVFGFTIYIPDFLIGALDGLKACMGPLAMILAGFIVASYSLSDMLKDKRIYIATFFRLLLLPAALISILFALVKILNFTINMNIPNGVIFLAFFATAAPLGLNTIIFTAAYGGNPETGAGMTMISHTFCVITIPILYSILINIFGNPVFI